MSIFCVSENGVVRLLIWGLSIEFDYSTYHREHGCLDSSFIVIQYSTLYSHGFPFSVLSLVGFPRISTSATPHTRSLSHQPCHSPSDAWSARVKCAKSAEGYLLVIEMAA